MPIDYMSITICCLLVLFALTTPLCNGLSRRPARQKDSDGQAANPSFSIVITAHDKAKELERNLPLFLSQEYENDVEVIVVNESSTDETDDVLKRLKTGHPNLYTTFIPDSSHYISRKKLAMTIGVKAAHNDWIVFTDADCRPASPQWLSAIATHCGEGADAVLGYTNYDHYAKPYYRFERLLTACHCLRAASKGATYRYNGNCIALRRKTFMENNGFQNNLKYLRGEYDFLANDYARPSRTSIAIELEAHTIQDAPTRKQWANTNVFFMETRRHLKRKRVFRMVFNIDNLLLHANIIFQIAALAYALLAGNAIITAAAALSFAITAACKLLIARKAIRFYGDKMAVWPIPLMELRVAWQNLAFMLRHRLSDKYDYIRNN